MVKTMDGTPLSTSQKTSCRCRSIELIPRYSAMGAAIATVVSYAIASVFANAFSAKTRPVFYMQMRSLIPAKFWDLSDERGDMLHSGR